MERKAEILDHAERLLRTRGYDGFSYADLEKEIGIRKASIHHHYARKSDLALALVERYCDRLEEKLASIAARERSAAVQLMDYLDLYRAALSGGEMVCLCVALSVTTENLSPQVQRQLSRYHDNSISWLERVFERAVIDRTITNPGDKQIEATACLAQVEGGMLIARAEQNTLRFEAAVAGLRQRVNIC